MLPVRTQERRHGIAVDRDTRVQADEAERAGGLRIQALVGPGEHRADRGARICGRVQQIQPALLVSKLGHQVRQGCLRARGGQLGGHPQRERQPGTLPGQLGGSGRVGAGPGPDEVPQQAHGIVQRQEMDLEAGRPVPGDQAGQRVTAGDDGNARSRAREQRPDLLGRAGVVQHDQHPPAGQLATVPSRALVWAGRDIRAGRAERAQERGQHLRRRHRLGRAVAAQIRVQLAVREMSGLADTGRAGDSRDHRSVRRPPGLR